MAEELTRSMTASPWATACSIRCRRVSSSPTAGRVHGQPPAVPMRQMHLQLHDKDHAGMLMAAAMRLNIPVIFVSSRPMEAGKVSGTRSFRSTSSMRWC